MNSVFDVQLAHNDTLKPNTRLLPANVAKLKTFQQPRRRHTAKHRYAGIVSWLACYH